MDTKGGGELRPLVTLLRCTLSVQYPDFLPENSASRGPMPVCGDYPKFIIISD